MSGNYETYNKQISLKNPNTMPEILFKGKEILMNQWMAGNRGRWCRVQQERNPAVRLGRHVRRSVKEHGSFSLMPDGCRLACVHKVPTYTWALTFPLCSFLSPLILRSAMTSSCTLCSVLEQKKHRREGVWSLLSWALLLSSWWWLLGLLWPYDGSSPSSPSSGVNLKVL